MENEDISITLKVSQWNSVMQALGNMPFAQVVGVIQEIKTQADREMAALQSGPTGGDGE